MKGSMRYMVIMSLVAICAALAAVEGSRNGSSTSCYLVAPITTAFSLLSVGSLDSEETWNRGESSVSGTALIARTINEIISGISEGGRRGRGHDRA
jgi:hypothetical protein